MKEKKTRTFVSNERMEAIIEELMEFHAFSSFSALIQSAIMDKYLSTFPPYRSGGSALGKLSPEKAGELKFRQKAAEKKAAEDARLEPKRKICTDILLGDVVDRDGVPYCVWKNHTLLGSDEQAVPLHSVSETFEPALFVPSREIVFKKRPEVEAELRKAGKIK